MNKMEEFFDFDAQSKYPDALQLTRVKALLSQKTVWKTDEYDDEKPLLVDDHDPIRFTINWCRETEKRHPNQYAVNKRINKGESWTWVTRFFNEPKEVADYLIETKLCEGKMSKKQFFESLLNEANIEVYPQDGKLQARNIGQQVVSSKTHNKTSDLDVKAVSQPLTKTQLDGTKAVIAYLKSQNKLNDISTQFDTDPHPDIVFNGAGDAIITPDGGKGRPYAIPVEKLEPFYESKITLFDKLLEDIEDFPQSTHQMYRFARRRHNDTGAVRKVSGQPYWVHPEGVALIVMKHGGSDTEIKAAMAHDVLEDTGDTFEDMVEKFGYEVASIVNEITNDKDEIKKVGKEQYISDELCRISDEALTVKLADMLYNQKDSPTESNYIRMRNNVNYMLNNREGLLPIHKELAQEILDV